MIVFDIVSLFLYTISLNTLFPKYLKPISKDRQKLHQEIDKLHQQGWDYTKIHHHLVKNGFKIGKSRTCVDSIIKKMKRKHDYISQPILDEIGNFRIEIKKV